VKASFESVILTSLDQRIGLVIEAYCLIKALCIYFHNTRTNEQDSFQF